MKRFIYTLAGFSLFLLFSGCDDTPQTNDNCGDGVVDIGEECDGSDFNGDSCENLGYHGGALICNSDCTLDITECEASGRCGDGTINGGSEECDGLNLNSQSCSSLHHGEGELSCSSNCTFDYSNCTSSSVCGNGVIEAGETCDGTYLNGATCESLHYNGGTLICDPVTCELDMSPCEQYGSCGDGNIQSPYEECEGTNLNGETCESQLAGGNGSLSCDNNCHFDTSSCGYCGDGIINGTEVCDSSNIGGNTCLDLGYYDTGSLSCNSDCSFNESGCASAGFCGDGAINGVEECDLTNLGGSSCLDLGYYADGSLACDNTCNFDTTSCGYCGDGILNGNEECDLTVLGGNTCIDLGYYTTGSLSCNSNCSFNESGCATAGFCGDGTLNGAEVCDGSQFSPDACISVGAFSGTPDSCDSNCIPSSSGCINSIVWGSAQSDYGVGIAIDSSDNIYIAGTTYGNLDGNTNNGESDIFLTKYNSSGIKQWTREWGTTAGDYGNMVAVDASGNIYVTGYTGGNLDSNTNNGSDDIFLTKYNSSGVKQWTKLLGTTSYDYGYSLAIDASGNIYVTGYTGGMLDSETNAGSDDIFLTKFNSSGVKQWTKLLGSSEGDYGNAVATDSSGNIYITGYTRGDLDGNTNAGSDDIFLAKFNSSGTKIWTRQWGTASDESGYGIAVDTSGNIYITGSTSGDLDGNTNAGEPDVFLTKFDTSGTKQWTRQLGTSTWDYAAGVVFDGTNSIYVSGVTSGDLDGNINAGVNNGDIFLTKYDTSGTKQWTKQWGTSEDEGGNKVAIDSTGYITITGDTTGTLGGNSNAGFSDIFILRTDPNP